MGRPHTGPPAPKATPLGPEDLAALAALGGKMGVDALAVLGLQPKEPEPIDYLNVCNVASNARASAANAKKRTDVELAKRQAWLEAAQVAAQEAAKALEFVNTRIQNLNTDVLHKDHCRKPKATNTMC